MPSARFPLSGVGASPLQTSCLLGRTSLSPPLPASFFGGLGFFPFGHSNPHVDLTCIDGNDFSPILMGEKKLSFVRIFHTCLKKGSCGFLGFQSTL